jgi:hypothetical protein
MRKYLFDHVRFEINRLSIENVPNAFDISDSLPRLHRHARDQRVITQESP